MGERRDERTNKIYSFINTNEKLLNRTFLRICEDDVQGKDANRYIVYIYRLAEEDVELRSVIMARDQ